MDPVAAVDLAESRPAGASAPDPAPAGWTDPDFSAPAPDPDFSDPAEAGPPMADVIEPDPADWAWVEEWRAGGERVPWGPGLTVAAFVALVVGSAVFVLSAGLAENPLIAIVVNLVVAGGITPAVWLARDLPVLRWVAGGAAIGVLCAWLGALIFLA